MVLDIDRRPLQWQVPFLCTPSKPLEDRLPMAARFMRHAFR